MSQTRAERRQVRGPDDRAGTADLQSTPGQCSPCRRVEAQPGACCGRRGNGSEARSQHLAASHAMVRHYQTVMLPLQRASRTKPGFYNGMLRGDLPLARQAQVQTARQYVSQQRVLAAWTDPERAVGGRLAVPASSPASVSQIHHINQSSSHDPSSGSQDRRRYAGRRCCIGRARDASAAEKAAAAAQPPILRRLASYVPVVTPNGSSAPWKMTPGSWCFISWPNRKASSLPAWW